MRSLSFDKPPSARVAGRVAVVMLAVFPSLTLGMPSKSHQPIKVLHPKNFSGADVDAVRTPLGIPNDYKPWIAKLNRGQLFIVAFCFGALEGESGYNERAVFWRSRDGGKTWGARQERRDVRGREFALNVLHDGTLLMPCHLLAQDQANGAGYTHSKLFRSTDRGATWSEIRVGPGGFPPNAQTATDWTTFELPDPERLGKYVTYFGVSMQHGGADAPANVRLWRSRDGGATWDKTLRPDTGGWSDVDGFFSQSVTHRMRTGKLLHVVRVDRTGPHWHIRNTPKKLEKESGDQGDRMMLWESHDAGRTWRRHNQHGTFGAYGEMYPRFLQLSDGRVLLTFTVRSNSTDGHALGLRAIVSEDGESFDFTHDRLVIDAQNVGASGGGFGGTVEVDGGKLVSVYSYRGEDGKTHIEAVRWALPAAK